MKKLSLFALLLGLGLFAVGCESQPEATPSTDTTTPAATDTATPDAPATDATTPPAGEGT